MFVLQRQKQVHKTNCCAYFTGKLNVAECTNASDLHLDTESVLTYYPEPFLTNRSCNPLPRTPSIWVEKEEQFGQSVAQKCPCF